MVKLLSKLEFNGIKVDNIYLKKLSKNFEEKLKKIEKEIYSIAGKEFNIGSPKQLGDIIFKNMSNFFFLFSCLYDLAVHLNRYF